MIVLILVLMEDALRVYYVSGNQFDAMTVLILVLMEDALRVLLGEEMRRATTVLILVLMEDALREGD